jgi:UDP-glucose 4-epimerase
VTGGGGFIGASLVRALEAEGAAVTVVDDGRAAGTALLVGVAARLVPGDLGLMATRGELQPLLAATDAVVHLAARTGVPASIADPAADFKDNVDASLALLELARRNGVERFIFASSNAAVGTAEGPISERTVPRPTSPYGAAKLAVEGYLSAYAASYGMTTVAIRFANVYGPYALHKRSVIASFLLAGLKGRPLTVYGDGSQARDLVHVDDLVRLIRASLDAPGERVAGQILQGGSGVRTPIGEVARLVADVLGPDVAVVHEAARTGDVAGAACDLTLSTELVGYRAQVALREGISSVAAWFRQALDDPRLAPLADR